MDPFGIYHAISLFFSLVLSLDYQQISNLYDIQIQRNTAQERECRRLSLSKMLLFRTSFLLVTFNHRRIDDQIR
jgi:hypothetical protein